MHSKPLIELIDGKCLKTIAFSDKPLTQNAEIIYLTHEEFEQKFNFKYTESLIGNPTKYSQYINNPSLCDSLRKNPGHPQPNLMRARLNNPIEHFVICKINENVGCGLFTTKDILPDTVLFMYSGKLEPLKTYTKGEDYQFIWIEEIPIAIDARKFGGLSRFMQHLPLDEKESKNYTKRVIKKLHLHLSNAIIEQSVADLKTDEFNELKEVQFIDENLRKNLATANVLQIFTEIDGIPITIFIATRKIKKNEQIGFDYTAPYWANKNQKPKYFSMTGDMIPTQAEYSDAMKDLEQKIKALQPKSVNPNVDLQTPYTNKNMNLLFRSTAIHPKCTSLLKNLYDQKDILQIDVKAKGNTSGTALDIAKKYKNEEAITVLTPYF